MGWSSPVYEVEEGRGHLRLTVVRTGGGVGVVSVAYTLEHLKTDHGDVTPTARWRTSSSEGGVGIPLFDRNWRVSSQALS